jgi:hypothetical protein
MSNTSDNNTPFEKHVSIPIKKVFSKKIIWVFTLGVAFTCWGTVNYNWPLWTDIISHMITAVGTTILAASIVSFIISDRDYANLLKKQIVSVIFSPENYKSVDELTKVWKNITTSLLNQSLPFSKDC